MKNLEVSILSSGSCESTRHNTLCEWVRMLIDGYCQPKRLLGMATLQGSYGTALIASYFIIMGML